MTYDQACETTVTRDEARREIELHGSAFQEFISECGDHASYPGRQVLAWLGY